MGKIFDRLFIGTIVWLVITTLYSLVKYIGIQIGSDTWQQNMLVLLLLIGLSYITGFVCEKIEEKLNKN